MLKSFTHTRVASYLGSASSAIVGSFTPLLLVIFGEEFSLTLAQTTLLISLNFAVQFCVDLICVKLADVIGYRAGVVAAHLFVTLGIGGLAVLPFAMPSFAGLIVSVVLYAIGGGLLEVFISPIVEACPSRHKAGDMSLLHSFFCWGTAFVVLCSTLFLLAFGQESWRILAAIWAVLPLGNAVYFLFVPLNRLVEQGQGMKVRELFSNKTFWLFVVVMMTAGASELSMSQWASTFAERGLGVTKAWGDLAGPFLFAVLMGLSRVLFSKLDGRMDMKKGMALSCLLCIAAYLIAALSPLPELALVGCGLCGFAVGIFWPGAISLASQSMARGGTAMFALLALAGDMGCTVGPALVGTLSDGLGGDLQTGLLIALVFPVLMLILLLLFRKKKESIPFREEEAGEGEHHENGPV